MKVPDKIYVREFAEGLNQMWSHIKATETSAIAQYEYIRKYALLEWAKGEIMPGNSAEGKGWNMAMQTLIDKIESL